VPEIKKEVPSDQELAAYLNESLADSSFSLLADYPQRQNHYHPEVVEALSYLSSWKRSSEFLATFKDSIFQSAQRLNKLPRTDPFWHNTNLRPTVFKLTAFCERILSTEPNDTLALLTISAMTIFHTSDFQRGRWTQLHALNAVSPQLIVFAAMLLEVSGADDRNEFSEFINSTGTSAAVTPLLNEIANHGGKLLSDWSLSVIASLATQ
jgi:hypothetical protein